MFKDSKFSEAKLIKLGTPFTLGDDSGYLYLTYGERIRLEEEAAEAGIDLQAFMRSGEMVSDSDGNIAGMVHDLDSKQIRAAVFIIRAALRHYSDFDMSEEELGDYLNDVEGRSFNLQMNTMCILAKLAYNGVSAKVMEKTAEALSSEPGKPQKKRGRPRSKSKTTSKQPAHS